MKIIDYLTKNFILSYSNRTNKVYFMRTNGKFLSYDTSVCMIIKIVCRVQTRTKKKDSSWDTQVEVTLTIEVCKQIGEIVNNMIENIENILENDSKVKVDKLFEIFLDIFSVDKEDIENAIADLLSISYPFDSNFHCDVVGEEFELEIKQNARMLSIDSGESKWEITYKKTTHTYEYDSQKDTFLKNFMDLFGGE